MNESQRERVQATVRVIVFLVSYAAIFLGLGLVLGMAPPQARLLVAGTLITLVTLGLTKLLARSEGTTMAFAGAAWGLHSIKRFAVGLGLGTGMIVLLVAFTRVVAGPVSFTRMPEVDFAQVALMMLTYVALAAGEELGFRGYPFQRLRHTFGTWTAQLIMAVAFAGYHMLQGWPPVNALVGTTAGSILFGVATIASGGLAFPIGLHAAWNIGSWLLGTKGEAGYWRMDLGTQPSWAGGAAIYLAVMAVGIAAISAWARRVRELT